MANEIINSVGLMGLPHFRSSRISRENMEVVNPNLFTVTIQLPKALTSESAGANAVSDADLNLVLEEVQSVDGLDTNKIPINPIEQNYKGATRSIAGTIPDKTCIDVGFNFAMNLKRTDGTPSNFVLRTLRKWNDLIYDPLTGRMGLKVDYIAPLITVVLHTKDGIPYWQWMLYNCFPITNIPTPQLDYSKKNEAFQITGYKLRCDMWDEVQL